MLLYKAKTRKGIKGNTKIRDDFCSKLSASFPAETVSKSVWPRMARMDLDCNLKNLAPFFQVCLGKIANIGLRFVLSLRKSLQIFLFSAVNVATEQVKLLRI